jgi:hypothetical protein
LTVKIEEKTFRGWDLDEDPGMTPATVLLGPMFKCLEPLEVIQKAMSKAGIKGESYFFLIGIMNNFGLLLFIKFQKIQKHPNWVEITDYHVLGLICTPQKGQQITKLDF